MHPTQRADRLRHSGAQPHDGVSASASPEAGRHTTPATSASFRVAPRDAESLPFPELTSNNLTPAGVCHQPFWMPAPPAGADDAASSISWFSGTPPLPKALLWSTVGNFDVIKRLGRHAHQVKLPEWSCICCGLAWPCEAARNDLLLDLGWIKVSIYCAALMERAARDLGSLTPKELWERFVEWTEPPKAVRDLLLTDYLTGN